MGRCTVRCLMSRGLRRKGREGRTRAQRREGTGSRVLQRVVWEAPPVRVGERRPTGRAAGSWAASAQGSPGRKNGKREGCRVGASWLEPGRQFCALATMHRATAAVPWTPAFPLQVMRSHGKVLNREERSPDPCCSGPFRLLHEERLKGPGLGAGRPIGGHFCDARGGQWLGPGRSRQRRVWVPDVF